jgi:diketogulonate reductase-like aldo/keto reductase
MIARLPAIGLGTFGSDRYGPGEVAGAVERALELGFTHIDCAAVYGNEAEIGAVLRRFPRESVWVTGKVWNDRHDDVRGACERSLRDLRLEVLDLYLVHWPFPNHHAAGVDVDARDPHAVSFAAERYLETWAQMERLVRDGLVLRIGTSNMTPAKLAAVLPSMVVRPYANQMELHPHFQQPELFDRCRAEGILPVGYSPLGSPGRPERDRTPEDTRDLDDPVVQGILCRPARTAT